MEGVGVGGGVMSEEGEYYMSQEGECYDVMKAEGRLCFCREGEGFGEGGYGCYDVTGRGMSRQLLAGYDVTEGRERWGCCPCHHES